MKNKILKTMMITLITANIGGTIHYEQKIKHNDIMISKLQDNVKTKSTKIAKLDDVIKLKNEKISQQQKVIDNNENAINELKKEVIKLQQENFKKKQEGSDVGSRKLTVTATAYIAKCAEGCTGRTRTGVDVSNTIYYKGYRVIAVDTSLIPLNSLVKVETKNESFTAMAIDTGGAIHGRIIDVLVGSYDEAIKFGRQQATLTILREGE